MTKKPEQKFKYLENEKSFKAEIKSFFVIFKGLSVAKNCLRPESALYGSLTFNKLPLYTSTFVLVYFVMHNYA